MANQLRCDRVSSCMYDLLSTHNKAAPEVASATVACRVLCASPLKWKSAYDSPKPKGHSGVPV